MAQEILNRLSSAFAVDVIGVYDQNYNQVFREARPLKAIIKEPSKTMEHPVETGSVTADHRIILQVEIELFLMLTSADYASVFQNIKQLFLEATLLLVQTRVDVYTNQLIADISHEETAEVQNGIILPLKLIETQIFQAEYSELEISPANPQDSNTISRGTIPPVNATPVQEEKTSTLSRIFG